MNYQIETKIQQPKTFPISLIEIMDTGLPLSLSEVCEKTQVNERFCFSDQCNNLKVVENYASTSRSFLLTKLNTKMPEFPFTCLLENPITNRLFASDSTGRIFSYRISSKPENFVSFKPHVNKINNFDFSETGTLILTSSNDKTVKIYDISKLDDPKKGATFSQSFMLNGHVRKSLFLNDNVLSLDGKSLKCFDIEKKTETFSYDCFSKQQFVDFHTMKQNLLILIDEKSEFRILDLRTNELVRAFSISNFKIKKSKFSEKNLRMLIFGESINPITQKAVSKLTVFNIFEPNFGKMFEAEPNFKINDI